jgi:predicted lipoprotein with Yx(FWY)xxD motif
VSELMSKPKLSAMVLSAGVLALAGCGSSSNNTNSSASTPAPTTPAATTPATSTTSAASSAQVSTKSVSTLGPILVNSEGRTLYIFEPDKHAKVTCTGACASLWPPLKLSSGQKAVAGGEAKSSLLSSDPDPEGGAVATYAGWPLYTYAADPGPGSANGQGVNADGGVWYVISPAGTVVEKMP